MKRLRRILFTGLARLSLVSAVALGIIWVRSHWIADSAGFHLAGMPWTRLNSKAGTITYELYSDRTRKEQKFVDECREASFWLSSCYMSELIQRRPPHERWWDW